MGFFDSATTDRSRDRKGVGRFTVPCFRAVRHKILVSSTVTPRLFAIDGPLKGSTFDILNGPFSIGRKSDNTISAADLSISRHHCTIESAGKQFRLIDHDSQNGTFLNGIPIRERALSHGDRIVVGTSIFVYLMEAQDPAARCAPSLRHSMVGESPAVQHVLEFIARVAPLDSTVLITGERGSGKKTVARVLHDNSPRAQKPFVAVNCAAANESLLQSDLFGQEAGACAVAAKGKLELAEGGTVYLDEIGEMALPLQNKLLRILQEKKFERVDGTRTLTANFCLIASSSSDLGAAVQAGTFRPDLYYRLCVLPVTLPPLRQRREDIPLLANYFRLQESIRQKRRVLGITAAARDCLLHYHWPGNVSELQSAIETAVAIGSTEGILPEDLPDSVLPGVDAPDDALPRFNQVVIETKRELILKAYQDAHGSYAQAAALLGLHPNSLLRMVRSLDLQTAVESLSAEGRTHSSSQPL